MSPAQPGSSQLVFHILCSFSFLGLCFSSSLGTHPPPHTHTHLHGELLLFLKSAQPWPSNWEGPRSSMLPQCPALPFLTACITWSYNCLHLSPPYKAPGICFLPCPENWARPIHPFPPFYAHCYVHHIFTLNPKFLFSPMAPSLFP